jgi:hypothetical protein
MSCAPLRRRRPRISACCGAPSAQAAKRTVCTITVNSADEREVFKQRLPEGDYDFVELVERRPPGLARLRVSQGVRAISWSSPDISTGMTSFYSDRLAMRESLPVSVMERASCSESCPGVFSQLKEVYLFRLQHARTGADDKHDRRRRSAALLRSGYSPRRRAAGRTRARPPSTPKSSREPHAAHFRECPGHLRLLELAPLGPTARRCSTSTSINRRAPSSAAANGNPKLLGQFRGEHDGGVQRHDESDPDAQFRAGDLPVRRRSRLGGEKLAFVHGVLRRGHGGSPDVPRSDRRVVRFAH